MTAKSLLIVGALGLSSLAFAGTKTYNIILDSATKAGDTELKAGEYKLKVEGSEAVFTQNDKTWKAPVKIQNSNKKFEQTTVETSSAGGEMGTIKAIDLGGSNTQLQFGQ
jgi:hypothetical protein